MRILHTVEFYHPSVGGMQEVVRQLSERLARLGHDVTVATTKISQRRHLEINGVKIAEFAVSGNAVGGMRGEWHAYREFLLDADFDIITNFAAQQWATDVALPILDEIKAKKVFVPTGFSELYGSEYEQYFEQMKQWMHNYDMNVFLSYDYRDINFARAANVGKIMVIPNGAAADEFLADTGINIKEKLNIPVKDMLILHVGSHTGQKGHAEAIQIFNQAKIDNAALVIIANNFNILCAVRCQLSKIFLRLNRRGRRKGKKLIVTQLPRSETVSAYQNADLFLFPSNIECSPLVLFECMASKTPFLATDVGNAREIATWSDSGLILPTITDGQGFGKADVAKAVSILEEICQDRSKREAMANNGFDNWQEKFTWEHIAKQYEALYLGLV